MPEGERSSGLNSSMLAPEVRVDTPRRGIGVEVQVRSYPRFHRVRVGDTEVGVLVVVGEHLRALPQALQSPVLHRQEVGLELRAVAVGEDGDLALGPVDLD